MHDVRAIRETPEAYRLGWSRRGVADADDVVRDILEQDTALRAAKTGFETAQAERNAKSKLIGAAKAKRDEARAAELMAEVEALKGALFVHESAQKEAETALHDLLAGLPNLAAAGVPEGEDEHENVEQKRWGDPAATPAGRAGLAANHADLGEAMGLMDFESAARMSGARFVALKGGLARMERALGQFMLDIQTVEHGYTEVSPPLLVRDNAAFGTGQLPKFGDDLFSGLFGLSSVARFTKAEVDYAVTLRRYIVSVLENIANVDGEFSYEALKAASKRVLAADYVGEGARDSVAAVTQLERDGLTLIAQREPSPEDLQAPWRILFPTLEAPFSELQGKLPHRLWLIPTAEVSLTNLVREQITPEEELPLRLTALTPSFRSEAGASGRDTRGMIRQHQFYKVELVSITTPDTSNDEHERMTACAETVLERLGLPYRRMLLCDGDMGFSAQRTYDLEVWLPSEGRYREISSCSNCGDFQARRMDARTKATGSKGTRFVHTLNGSGLAVGRTLVAVMENYQDEGGRVAVPEALLPYMGGATHVGGAA